MAIPFLQSAPFKKHRTRLQTKIRSADFKRATTTHTKFTRRISKTQKFCAQPILDALSLSSVPKRLVGRDSQLQRIERFIESKLNDNSTPKRALLVFGPPGTGKTAAVTVALSRRRTNPRGDIVNCMHYAKVSDLSKAIGSLLFKKQKTTPSSLTSLLKTNRTPKLLVIDEIDRLFETKLASAAALYCALSRDDHLVLIGISNKVEVSSLFEKDSKLLFEPYGAQEIEGILSTRLDRFEFFEEPALSFLSKKVAADSGDIRRALGICRSAVEENSRAKNAPPLISFSAIKAISMRLDPSSALVERARKLPTKQKVVLCAAFVFSQTKRRDGTKAENFYRFYVQSARKLCLPNIAAGEFSQMADLLDANGLIKTTKGGLLADVCLSKEDLTRCFENQKRLGELINGV